MGTHHVFPVGHAVRVRVESPQIHEVRYEEAEVGLHEEVLAEGAC